MPDSKIQPRRVAVAIPYSIDSKTEIKTICLVSSRKHDNRYVLPKGGIEAGETSREAAIRELWEEAGLIPISTDTNQSSTAEQTFSNSIEDHKAHKKSHNKNADDEGFIPRAIYEAHEIQVQRGDIQSECQDWPEKEERSRKWTSISEGAKLIEWRKDIHTLLLRSSLGADI